MEVVTERSSLLVAAATASLWVARVVGGKFDGLIWGSKDEREAIDRHVALVALLRIWEESCER